MCAKTCQCNSCYKRHTCSDCFYMSDNSEDDCFENGVQNCSHYIKRRWVKNEDTMETKVKK